MLSGCSQQQNFQIVENKKNLLKQHAASRLCGYWFCSNSFICDPFACFKLLKVFDDVRYRRKTFFRRQKLLENIYEFAFCHEDWQIRCFGRTTLKRAICVRKTFLHEKLFLKKSWSPGFPRKHFVIPSAFKIVDERRKKLPTTTFIDLSYLKICVKQNFSWTFFFVQARLHLSPFIFPSSLHDGLSFARWQKAAAAGRREKNHKHQHKCT